MYNAVYRSQRLLGNGFWFLENWKEEMWLCHSLVPNLVFFLFFKDLFSRGLEML